MADSERDHIEAEIAKLDASIKQHATRWLELDKSKSKRRDRGGLYAILMIVGLLILANRYPELATSMVQGFALGVALMIAGWIYDYRSDEIGREMDRQFAMRRENEHKRELLHMRLDQLDERGIKRSTTDRAREPGA